MTLTAKEISAALAKSSWAEGQNWNGHGCNVVSLDDSGRRALVATAMTREDARLLGYSIRLARQLVSFLESGGTPDALWNDVQRLEAMTRNQQAEIDRLTRELRDMAQSRDALRQQLDDRGAGQSKQVRKLQRQLLRRGALINRLQTEIDDQQVLKEVQATYGDDYPSAAELAVHQRRDEHARHMLTITRRSLLPVLELVPEWLRMGNQLKESSSRHAQVRGGVMVRVAHELDDRLAAYRAGIDAQGDQQKAGGE